MDFGFELRPFLGFKFVGYFQKVIVMVLEPNGLVFFLPRYGKWDPRLAIQAKKLFMSQVWKPSNYKLVKKLSWSIPEDVPRRGWLCPFQGWPSSWPVDRRRPRWSSASRSSRVTSRGRRTWNKKKNMYSVFHRFGKAKFAYGGSILSLA